jgi:hypothetical protein
MTTYPKHLAPTEMTVVGCFVCWLAWLAFRAQAPYFLGEETILHREKERGGERGASQVEFS